MKTRHIGLGLLLLAGSAAAIIILCDGCAGGLVAGVSFISAQAEFTPPIIYSQEERSRLVYSTDGTDAGRIRPPEPPRLKLPSSARGPLPLAVAEVLPTRLITVLAGLAFLGFGAWTVRSRRCVHSSTPPGGSGFSSSYFSASS